MYIPKKKVDIKEEYRLESEKFPLKLLEIVLTTFLINTFIMMLYQMDDVGFDVFTFSFSCAPIYIPIGYSFWIYKSASTHLEYLSEKRMHNALYLTALFTFLVSLAQIREFDLLISEKMTLSNFISNYLEKTVLHPLFCALIVLMFIYVQFFILKEKRVLSFYVNIFFLIAFLRPVVNHAKLVISTFIQLIGFYPDRTSYLTVLSIFLVVFLYIFSKIFKFNFSKLLSNLSKRIWSFFRRTSLKFK